MEKAKKVSELMEETKENSEKLSKMVSKFKV